MRSVTTRWASLWLLGMAGCIDTQLDPIDMEGPRVLEVTPAPGSEISLQPSIVVTFTKALHRPSIERPAYTIALSTRYQLDAEGQPELDDFGQPEKLFTEAMITDLNAGTGGLDSDSYRAKTVPLSVSLDDDDKTLRLMALEELLPRTEYQLVFSTQIRDSIGNRLGVIDCQPHITPRPPECSPDYTGLGPSGIYGFLYFVTEAGPPTVIASDLPGATNSPLPGGVVPVNRGDFGLQFDREMNPNAGVGGIQLKVSTEDDIVIPLTTTPEGDRWVFASLPDLSDHPSHQAFCPNGLATWKLCPDTAYELVVTSDLTDQEGASARSSRHSFRSGSDPDEDDPVVTEPVVVQVGETEAQLLWETDEPSSTELMVGGEVLRGEPSSCAPGDPCLHEYRLSGLELGQSYDVQAMSRDLALNTWLSDTIQVTPVELPDLAITEVHANAREEGGLGEFVEVYNYGEEDLDLEGWSLVRSGTETRAVLPAGAVVPARSVAVLVDDSFNSSPYPGLSADAKIEVDLIGLVNSNLYLELVDEQGRRVDSSSELDSNVDGRSLVRDRVDTDRFCDGPPTPGEWQANSCAGG